MKRREFMLLAGVGAVSTVAPFGATAGLPGFTAYTPGLVDKLLAQGKTVFVDFATDWCSTCKSQERTITRLMAANPAYAQAMEMVRVDWDVYSGDALSKRLAIPRRSTLVVLKGNQEIGRIVAGTLPADIQALLDAGLAAATS